MYSSSLLPRSYPIIYNLVIDILKTHPFLDMKDIEYTANIVCNLNLDNKQLAKFLLHSFKRSNIGKFTLTFNHNLDYYIKNRDKDKLQLLISLSENDAFIELFDNPLLNSTEISTIYDIYKLEFLALLNTIEYTLSLQSSESRFDSLYSKCYIGICNYKLENGCTNDILQSYQIPSSIPISDFDIDNQADKIYYFDLYELINLIINDNNINKFTNKPFSHSVYDLIKQKYNKEILMYKKFLSSYNSE